MGRAIEIRNADFADIAIGNVNNDIGNPNWVLGTHDYMDQFGNGGQLSASVLWFGDNFDGGANYFSGKTFTKFICRFQEADHGTELIGSTASVHIGHCNADGTDFTELTAVTATYNTVMDIPNGGITIPVGKTMYVYLTNKWIKTVSGDEVTALNLKKGIMQFGGGQVVPLPNTCLMFDIYESQTI